MSPTPFAQQISYLIDTLAACDSHCTNIRQKRSLGSTTINLDNLQSSLTTSTVAIESRFATLEQLLGSRIQVGDDISRTALNRSIRELELDIESRLHDISQKKERVKGSGGDEKVKKMGFGAMNEKVLRIEGDVVRVLDSLAQRIENSQQQQQRPQPQKQHCEPDEVVISLKELDALAQHLKNSWVEKNAKGDIFYVNCFDDKVWQWEKPEGAFIRSLPESQKSDSDRRERAQEEQEAAEENRRKKEKKERREREKREKEAREKKEAKEKREAEEQERILRERVEREFLERELREREREREREAFERELREQEARERERLRRMEEEQHQQRRPRARHDYRESQRGW